MSPAIRIDFVEVTRKVDGFKPCPVPLTTEQSTNIAVRRFMMFGKNKNKGVPVEPTKLAALIIDSYYQRGPLWESLQEDILLSQKYRFEKSSFRAFVWMPVRLLLSHQFNKLNILMVIQTKIRNISVLLN